MSLNLIGSCIVVKSLKPWGFANCKYRDFNAAAIDTYLGEDGKLEGTSFLRADNPFKEDFINAKNILEIGCGVGRNVPYILENTKANYFGIEPNVHMSKFFYVQGKGKEYKEEWLKKDRIYLTDDFDSFIQMQSFDVVISTYVFQHIGYRTPEHIMNVTDITQNIKKQCYPGTIWFLIEHETEEFWISRWLEENFFTPTVRKGIDTSRGAHDMIIIRQN